MLRAFMRVDVETLTLLVGIFSATLAAVTYYAWRMGNERRDVALLGAFSGAFGLGATALVVL